MVLLAGWQGAAAATAKLPSRPSVNIPIRVNGKLNCSSRHRTVKTTHVRGHREWEKERKRKTEVNRDTSINHVATKP